MVAALGALAIPSAGCNLQAKIEAEIQKEIPKGFISGGVHLGGSSAKGTFNFDGQKVAIKCRYRITVVQGGKKEEQVWDVDVEITGSKGGSYSLDCNDPLVAQFPADASAFTASATDKNGHTTQLKVKGGVHSVKLDHRRTLTAEGTQQLVIGRVPHKLPKGKYKLTLNFHLATSRSISVRSFMAAQARCGKNSFLVPTVPRVRKMSAAYAFKIPQSDTPKTVRVNLGNSVPSKQTVKIDCRKS